MTNPIEVFYQDFNMQGYNCIKDYLSVISKCAYCTRIIMGILIFAISMVIPVSGANAVDDLIRPQDIHENIYDAAVISETEYMLVGSRGRIFRSPDKGKSWQRIQSGIRKALYSVSFLSPDNGWICGQSGLILHTADAGKTWAVQNSGTKKHLFSISFGDMQHGCAVGDWGVIIKTNDGGQNWKDVSLSEDVILYGIYMADAQNGCIVGEFGKIYLTSDGGTSWLETQSPNPLGLSLFCICQDRDSLYAGGLDGLIFYSNDRGSTWQSAQTPVKKAIYGISMSGQTGWAVGDSGTVLRTEDGGKIWQVVVVPEAFKLFWLKAVKVFSGSMDQHGFTAGADGLYLNIKQQLSW